MGTCTRSVLGNFEGLNFVYKFPVGTKRMREWSDRVVKDIPVKFIKVYKMHYTSDCCPLDHNYCIEQPSGCLEMLEQDRRRERKVSLSSWFLSVERRGKDY